MVDYFLKYFADAKDQQGHYVRVEIYSKTPDPNAPYRMWGMNELSLNVQGGTGNIDSPIIKTNLSFSLVEPPVPSYGYDMDGNRLKKGGWSEFFTPISDAYKVILLTANTYGNWTRRWSGYITPDSWQESLDCYDSVKIIARDNLGHLQDFDFDPKTTGRGGIISIGNLISQAMSKLNMPMRYSIRDYENEAEHILYFRDEEGNENKITSAYINVALFEGKNWYEALEMTLESIGWVCRWVDYDTFAFMPLRNLPKMGYSNDLNQPKQYLEFYNGGTRTLEPAYKEIKEVIEYDQKETIERDAKYNLKGWVKTDSPKFRVESLTIYGTSTAVEHAAPAWLRLTSNEEDGWSNIAYALNPYEYPLNQHTLDTEGEGAGDYLFIATNLKVNYDNAGTAPVRWNRRVQSTSCKIRFEFTEHPMCVYPQVDGGLDTYPYNLRLIKYRVLYEKDGVTHYWDGHRWLFRGANVQNDIITRQYEPENKADSEFEIQLTECVNLGPNGKLIVEFADIQYVNIITQGYGYGCYARIRSVTIENTQKVNLRKNEITTINNADYNVKNKRTPAFSPFLKTIGFTTPENYKAGMFRVNGTSIFCWPYNCHWDNSQEQLPFPVQIHKQILQYHHVTSEVLEGQAGVVLEERDGQEPRKYPLIFFDSIFYYKGKKYLLLSANLDLLTGRLTSAIFREFLDWTDLWD